MLKALSGTPSPNVTATCQIWTYPKTGPWIKCRTHFPTSPVAVHWYRSFTDVPYDTLTLPSTRQHPSYGDCLEVKREYYQKSSVLDCVTQCSQSAAHLCEQFLQVKQIGFVTLGPLRWA